MYMKPDNAGKKVWLPAQALNEKLKQNAQTQEDDGTQVFLLFYIRHI